MDDPYDPANIERYGMPAGTKWVRSDASPEVQAEAGIVPGTFERMARGASHRMGVIHPNRLYCDDLACEYGCDIHRKREHERRLAAVYRMLEDSANKRPHHRISDRASVTPGLPGE